MGVTFQESLGAKIRVHRQIQQLTQEELAERSGTSASYIGQVERGEKDLRLSTVEKIARALGLEIQDIFKDEQESSLQQQPFVWESLVLMMQADPQAQRQAYRILQVLLAKQEE